MAHTHPDVKGIRWSPDDTKAQCTAVPLVDDGRRRRAWGHY